MMTDPIADMLTRLRNAIAVHKESADIPYSMMKHALAVILEREKYVQSIELPTHRQSFRVHLRYGKNGEPIIRQLIRMSKPGRRLYCAKDAIPVVLSGLGIAILSTSKGLMTNKEAKKLGIGGEFICTVA